MTASSTEGRASADTTQTGWLLPLLVLIAGSFVAILDISIINVAVPTIQNEFGANTSDAQWVVTGYALAEGVVVPVSAWLGDRLGLTRVYNLAVLGFTGGSALCGLAWSLQSLVVFRLVQGLLGGVLPATTMTILLRIVPRARLGTAVGLYGLGATVAPAFGPALGGYLVEYVNWRLIFFINVPIGILGVVAAVMVLPPFSARAGRRLDVLGFVTVVSAMFALLLALSKAEEWRWTSYRILGLIAFGVLSLALFVVIELAVEDPLLNLRVFRYTAFTQSMLLIVSLTSVLFAVLFYVPQFLQQAQGLGALDAGLALLPPALLMGLLMPLIGRLTDRIGPRVPAVTGLLIATLGTYLLHTITVDTSRERIILYLIVLYTGLGVGMMPIMSAGLAVIPPEHANAASAFTNVIQRTAGALGVAIFTAIVITQRAQLMAGRGALLPDDTPIPQLGADAPHWVNVYAIYQQIDLQVYADAIDNLFLIATVISAATTLGALLLRPISSHG